jgi:hypothetical protein
MYMEMTDVTAAQVAALDAAMANRTAFGDTVTVMPESGPSPANELKRFQRIQVLNAQGKVCCSVLLGRGELLSRDMGGAYTSIMTLNPDSYARIRLILRAIVAQAKLCQRPDKHDVKECPGVHWVAVVVDGAINRLVRMLREDETRGLFFVPGAFHLSKGAAIMTFEVFGPVGLKHMMRVFGFSTTNAQDCAASCGKIRDTADVRSRERESGWRGFKRSCVYPHILTTTHISIQRLAQVLAGVVQAIVEHRGLPVVDVVEEEAIVSDIPVAMDTASAAASAAAPPEQSEPPAGRWSEYVCSQ